jgi:hypothetical protein
VTSGGLGRTQTTRVGVSAAVRRNADSRGWEEGDGTARLILLKAVLLLNADSKTSNNSNSVQ